MIIDLHTHTRPKSEDSDLTPEELIIQAKRSGLDGVCFTEHDFHWKDEDVFKLSQEYDFPIFRGVEISCDEGDLLVFGLSVFKFGMHHAEFVRQLVDEVGGVMILAHPFRKRVRFQYNTTTDDILDSVSDHFVLDLVDAAEMLNGRSIVNENDFARELCIRRQLKGIGGSDAHSLDDIPTYATEFERRITSLDDLITEIKEGRFRAVDLH